METEALPSSTALAELAYINKTLLAVLKRGAVVRYVSPCLTVLVEITSTY